METTSFTSSITVNISADEAIKMITNIPGWWGISFSGNSEKKGDQFVIKMGGDSFFDIVVEDQVPERKIVWLVTDCYMPWYADKTEWTGTRLIFELIEHDGVTDLTFIHEGLTPAVECYKDCAPGWTHWIQTSLFSYLSTGKGVFRPATV